MLDINIEFRKGIMFVRLTGELNKKTVSKLNYEVTDLVKDNGIRNIVLNLKEIVNIDIKGINALLYNYELCKKNRGKILLCGLTNEMVREKIKNNRILRYIKESSNELSALDIIKV